MNTKNKELDRTFFKTHKSRSIKVTLLKNSGFTLIELLVVISIIALLSTIVLAVMNDARTKARNSAKNSLVLEYVNALELYRSDNGGSYPTTAVPVIGSPIPICFGFLDTESCMGTYVGSTSIKNSMQTYLPSDFAHRSSLIIGSYDYKGVAYHCPASAGDPCDSYTLTWKLEKTNQKCIYSKPSNVFSENSHCSYTKE